MTFQIAQPDSLIVSCNEYYVKKIFDWRGQSAEVVGNILKVDGYVKHNWLVDVNSIFSKTPTGMLVDRTNFAKTPLRFDIPRPWKVPQESYTLEQALHLRVEKLINSGHMINLYWSGGIDSTTMITAFLKHAPARNQLRIFYSPFSTYEHPQYLTFLKKFNDLELIDLSGMTYINSKFDGLFLTGDGGDEFMASVDESFFDSNGRQLLDLPWQDLFYKLFPDDQFIEFCKNYFSQAGRPMTTVLEARWFFYAMCKSRYQLMRKLPLFAHHHDFVPAQLLGFFDCEEFEKYIYWNLDHIIPGPSYQDWKLTLKQYCVNFDQCRDWFQNKKKVNSSQAQIYSNKKRIIEDTRSIFYLSDGQRIATPSLPLLSCKEFEKTYGNTLNYLFNDHDQI
jgi:hypothetical protein